MRLQRGTPVAGVAPETARDLARACASGWASASVAAHYAKLTDRPVVDVAAMLTALTGAGFLEQQDGPAYDGEGTEPEWHTTVPGNALAMASFLRPITRAKATQLLDGVLERAATYNADDSKPMLISSIAVFGSYLDETVTHLGDLDLAVTLAERRPGSSDSRDVRAYARASGRHFSSFLDELFWAEREPKMLLRNRSGYINVHTEDISRFTDTWRVVYEHPVPPGARRLAGGAPRTDAGNAPA